ncbi:acyl-CoA/acyl-ACP dehydrogenase [Streptomyces sp. NBC_01317]|uniref:acyl-CoA dehydrogenase family protein n=1 Tax=Streptomyces sp. NBC_01317 TaxID=2903822 RepID=UPI002E0E4A61|nr:acyl-CoA/acyl-ACP dehydrogenase [Streptomyces sp. NBC_01317]
MRFLEPERETLEMFLPGLDDRLASLPLKERERPQGPALTLFKEAGGPGLLVPSEHGGLGASAVQAVRLQRAVASRSPSLAVATTMHHFSVAGLIQAYEATKGLEWMLLQAVADQKLLMASGFAEGRSGQSILASSITARQDGDDIVLNGAKKPCSLSASMDLLTASVTLETGNGPQLAVALVPASTPGISVHPFWGTSVLAGAESDEVRLEDVRVPADMVVRTELSEDGSLDTVQSVGFIWFELMMAASYLGMAGALAERVLARERTDVVERARILVELEAAMGAVVGAASVLDGDGPVGQPELLQSLVVRFSVQDTIDRVVPRCLESLGGMSYVSSDETSYLAACAAALKFHPPSRAWSSQALCTAFAGGPLVLG